MTVQDEVLQLVELAYESVLIDAKWPVFLRQLARHLGGTGCAYVAADPRIGQIVRCKSFDVDPTVDQKYLEYYSAREVRLAPAIGFPVGKVITEGMLLPRKDLERSEIYSDLLMPCDVPNLMFAWTNKEPSLVETIAIEGSHRRGPFTDEETRKFAMLLPHIVRVMRLRRVLAATRQHDLAQRSILEALPFGVIILDATDCIVDATARAERMLVAGCGLKSRKRHLYAEHSADDQVLRNAIVRIKSLRAEGRCGAFTVRVRRPGKQPLIVDVMSIKSVEAFSAPGLSTMVVVRDPAESFEPPAALVSRMLRISEAEASLAVQLFRGLSMQEAANALRRSINTCKTQLKSVYGKTHCRSQVELVRMILVATLGISGEGHYALQPGVTA